MERLRNEFAELRPVERPGRAEGRLRHRRLPRHPGRRAGGGSGGRRLRVRGGRRPHVPRGRGAGGGHERRARSGRSPSTLPEGFPGRRWAARRSTSPSRSRRSRRRCCRRSPTSGPPRSASSPPCSSCARRSATSSRPARPTPPTSSSGPCAVKAAADNATVDLPDVVVQRAGGGDAGRLQALPRVAGRLRSRATSRPPGITVEQMHRGYEAAGGEQCEDEAGARRGGEGGRPRGHRRRGQRRWSARWPRPARWTPRRSRTGCARAAGSRR